VFDFDRGNGPELWAAEAAEIILGEPGIAHWYFVHVLGRRIDLLAEHIPGDLSDFYRQVHQQVMRGDYSKALGRVGVLRHGPSRLTRGAHMVYFRAFGEIHESMGEGVAYKSDSDLWWGSTQTPHRKVRMVEHRLIGVSKPT
jgi:hypothetical protein